MKKHFFLWLFLLVYGAGYGQAPVWLWAQKVGGTFSDIGYGIAVDASGNSYVTGLFSGTVTFGSTNLTSSGGANDIFVAKFDATGDVLWAQKAGGTSSDEGYGIAVDALGNSYVTGRFNGTATFGSTTLTSGSPDIFVVKYDTSGTVLWAKQAGGTGFDEGFGIAVDASGNSYVTGYFEGTATFDSTSLTSSGNSDIFIAKYDASGTVLWAHKAGGTSNDRGNGIAVDATGNSYVTGYFFGTATFGSTTLTSNGDIDVFVAKYDPSGTELWARRAGGTSDDIGYGIDVDTSGNSYLTGSFQDTANFDTTTLSSYGIFDMFLAKYDGSGTVLWAQKAGSTSNDIGNSIAVDASGNTYVTGYFRGTATFGSINLTSFGFIDVFIVKYDNSGAALWAQKAGGTGSDIGNSITVDNSDNSYVTGRFVDTATFGTSTLIGGGSEDIFIAKLNSPLPTNIKINETSQNNDWQIYPNPTSSYFTIQTSKEGTKTLTVMDLTGRTLLHKTYSTTTETFPTEGMPSGVYILRLEQAGSVSNHRLVIE